MLILSRDSWNGGCVIARWRSVCSHSFSQLCDAASRPLIIDKKMKRKQRHHLRRFVASLRDVENWYACMLWKEEKAAVPQSWFRMFILASEPRRLPLSDSLLQPRTEGQLDLEE